jgi:hypothetical protein
MASIICLLDDNFKVTVVSGLRGGLLLGMRGPQIIPFDKERIPAI